MAFLRLRPTLLLAPLLAAAPIRAQLAPLTVPKGLFRLDLGARFDNWDKGYFGGVKQDAAGDFIRNPATGAWLPSLGLTEQRLREVTGVQALSLSLGKTTASMLVNVGTESIGAAYGLTRRLTVFGTVPWVRVRVQQVFSLDSSTATAGFNPAHPVFGSGTSAFLTQLETAITTLDGRIKSGTYSGNALALAQSVLAKGTSLADLLGTSPFLPIGGTAAATALTQTIDSLRVRLRDSLGVDLFSPAPDLPTAGLPRDGIESFATNPSGPIVSQPFAPPILKALGDIEVGAAYQWLDHRAAAKGLAIRSVIQGTVRLRTGRLDRPDVFFDLPTGDRQPDVQADLVTDLARGSLGARITARYVLQLPGRQERRLTAPDQPIAPAATLAAVERDPGEIVEGILEPYFRLAPHFAIVGGIRHWAKGADRYKFVPNQDPIAGTTPDVLALGSKENGTVISAALSLAHDGIRRDGSSGMPIDASVRAEFVVGSSAGRVPVKQSISFVLRLYRKMF